MFFPDAEAAYKNIKKLKLTPQLVQVLTGHGGFSQYLHRFNIKSSPDCVCEPRVQETVEHLLLECPRFALARFDLELHIDKKIGKTSRYYKKKILVP